MVFKTINQKQYTAGQTRRRCVEPAGMNGIFLTVETDNYPSLQRKAEY